MVDGLTTVDVIQTRRCTVARSNFLFVTMPTSRPPPVMPGTALTFKACLMVRAASGLCIFHFEAIGGGTADVFRSFSPRLERLQASAQAAAAAVAAATAAAAAVGLVLAPAGAVPDVAVVGEAAEEEGGAALAAAGGAWVPPGPARGVRHWVGPNAKPFERYVLLGDVHRISQMVDGTDPVVAMRPFAVWTPSALWMSQQEVLAAAVVSVAAHLGTRVGNVWP